MNNIMLDIETLGDVSYSSILSIGAVKFDINTGETGDTFYVTVDLQSCLDAGLIITASTFNWWLEKDEAARNSLLNSLKTPLVDALSLFNEYCTKYYDIWGNSPRFDCGILANAYEKVGLDIPWDFRKERCVRTLVGFNPSIKANHKHTGVAHHALSDCYNQIDYCVKIYNSLKLC